MTPAAAHDAEPRTAPRDRALVPRTPRTPRMPRMPFFAALRPDSRVHLLTTDHADAMSEPDARQARTGLSKEDALRFRAIVDGHFDFIWRSLRGLGVPSAFIDDAAQQVFLAASKKLADIAVGSERAFLFSTARGVAANARRAQSRNREQLDEDALALQVDDAPNPEQAIASREARQVLDQILDGLPEETRVVFVLYELEGQTMLEIAALLGTPMGTVASRLRRAREEFQSAARRFQAARGNER